MKIQRRLQKVIQSSFYVLVIVCLLGASLVAGASPGMLNSSVPGAHDEMRGDTRNLHLIAPSSGLSRVKVSNATTHKIPASTGEPCAKSHCGESADCQITCMLNCTFSALGLLHTVVFSTPAEPPEVLVAFLTEGIIFSPPTRLLRPPIIR